MKANNAIVRQMASDLKGDIDAALAEIARVKPEPKRRRRCKDFRQPRLSVIHQEDTDMADQPTPPQPMQPFTPPPFSPGGKPAQPPPPPGTVPGK